MGFAFPKMQMKRSMLSASLILGIIHGLWHVLADFLGNSRLFGAYWLPYMTMFVVFVVALRVLIVWVYANTESLLLSQLIHASSTGFLAILFSRSAAPMNWMIFYAVYAVILWAVAAIVIARYGRGLARQPIQAAVT